MAIMKRAGGQNMPRRPEAGASAGTSGGTWRRSVKDRVVRWGIQAMCGSELDVQPAVAADIPLGSAAVRYLWLRMLEASGRKTIITCSGLGYDFMCHLGDLAEFPYYHRHAHRRELILCARWLSRLEAPVVLDVGANTGFFVTQLAQMTSAASPQFYAFEAVPSTYAKLAASIRRLGLERAIHPVAAPVLDKAREVRLACNERNSLLGRVMGEDEMLTEATVKAQAITIDGFCETHSLSPRLVKIDVEGWEPAVLRGASELLARERPAVLFEHNPERGCTEMAALLCDGPLHGYHLYYVDDLRGQVRPFGSAVANIGELSWICNLFAVPMESGARFAEIAEEALALF